MPTDLHSYLTTNLSTYFLLPTYLPYYQQEGNDGPVSLHWLIREIPSYQALQYLGIGLKHRPVTRTKIGSHSSYVKDQEDFERFQRINP